MTARSRSTAVLVTTLVVLSTVVAGGGIVGAQSDAGGANGTNATAETGVDLPPADDVYVEENGDAVLTYEGAADDTRTNYGLNVSEGLFHALVATDVEGSNDVAADMTAALTGDNLTGNGTLGMARPEALSNLSVNATGLRTDENARSDVAAAATVTGASLARSVPIERAGMEGNVTTTGSTFDADLAASAQLTQPLGQSQHQAYHISEGNGTYTLNVSQERPVFGAAASRWETREQAARTLRSQYVAIAESMNGSADLTIESYSFAAREGGRPRLDIEYSITYRGIERAVTDQVASSLTSAEDVDLSRSEARNVSQRLRNLTVNELSVRFDQSESSIEAGMSADLDNYDGAVLAALDVANATDMQSLNAGTMAGMGTAAGGAMPGNAGTTTGTASNASVMNPSAGANAASFNRSLERFRKQFAAQRAANLTREVSFAANVTKPSPQAISVDLESHTRTENWGQYVDELENRDIETNNLEYELHAATEGERVNVTAAVSVSGKNLLKQATNQMLNSSAGPQAGQMNEYVTAFREAGFQKAKMDVSLDDGRMRMETGAAFENMTALRDAFVTLEGDQSIGSVVGRTENGTTTSYVRVEDAVSENASESQVRELAYADDDTAVHLPNAWNRTMPSANTSEADEYLGMTGATSGLTGPGFGVVVAVIALLAAALVAARRRE
ncbi:PGF-CTERM sorting domain-containing protein [Halococcus agarilyticus]|uniref:PGF-CTERM sorting domain-containing protein n=1 Tax=Halococcus agarilyticus TaxID=1232219 RepID=UPI00067820B9|nr:PGF-CTERM sorting domain-containing protein [Halococcus agarilyticus]